VFARRALMLAPSSVTRFEAASTSPEIIAWTISGAVCSGTAVASIPSAANRPRSAAT
jgi:hypothetical protein